MINGPRPATWGTDEQLQAGPPFGPLLDMIQNFTPQDDARFRGWLATVLANAHTRPVAFAVIALELCKTHGLTMTCKRISCLERNT